MSITTFVLLGLLTLVILVLAVLVIYLSDRFNLLERETHDLMRKLQDNQQSKPSGPYAGLSGKALWDAVCGVEIGALDELVLDGVRKRYRLLLDDHLQSIFNGGTADANRGMDSVPTNTRQMRTPKVQVESWLPPEVVAEVYRCGQGYVLAMPEELPALRQRLDQVCAQLYEACHLETSHLASSTLMPPRPQDTAGDAGMAAAAAGAAGAAVAVPAAAPPAPPTTG